MSGAGPKEIEVIHVDQQENSMCQDVADQTSEATGKVLTAKEVNPIYNPFEGIAELGGQVIDQLGTKIGGEEPDSNDRATQGSKVLSIERFRELKRRLSNKKAA